MSSEARKNCRTQGKYSDRNHQYEDKRSRKSIEKRLKESPTEKETQEKKFLKRKSDGTKEGTSFSSENNESVLEYHENSEHSFSQLEERKKPIEIKNPGKTVLSNTEKGESSVLYEPNFYNKDEAWELFDQLNCSTDWLDKNIVIHGVEYPQPRLVAWYGPLPYSYSGTTLEPAEMPDCVLAIKKRIEDYLHGKNINIELNSVLLNLYRNNKDSVSWHSDDEFTMGVCPTIASISLGETRRFEMRRKPNRYSEDEHEKKEDECFVHLNNGSLIIMDGCMQEDWQHRVPKEYHDRDARINLTFRTVYKFENGSPYSDSRVNNNKLIGQETPKNSSRNKIDLDEENFPPLSSVSNNVNLKTVPKPHEKAEPSLTKTGKNTNKISEEKLENNYPSYESLSNINDLINNSEEPWTVETPPSNKATSRINDRSNTSEEKCIVKTKALFIKTTDAIGTSHREFIPKSFNSHRNFDKRDVINKQEEWDIEFSSCQKLSAKSNDTSNESKENSVLKSLSNVRAYTEVDYKIKKTENRAVKHYFPNSSNSFPNAQEVNDVTSATEEEWIINSPVKNNSYSEFGEINKSHYNCYEESAYNNLLTPLESNNKSPKDWCDESCNSQIFSESDEINVLLDERHENSYDYQQQTSLESDKIYQSNEDYPQKTYHEQTPLESNNSHENRNVKHFVKPNWFGSNKTNKYHEDWASKPFNRRNAESETNRYHRYNERKATEPFYNKNISRQEKNYKSDEVKSFESCNNESSNISNNGKRNVKIEMINENIDDCEQKSDKNQNSNTKERKIESANFDFAKRDLQRHFTDIRNESRSNRSNKWEPNVKAEEFIPGKMSKFPLKMDKCPSRVDSSTFGHLSLSDLLNCDMDYMPSNELKNYANVLKLRVLKEIIKFGPSKKEELEVLCKITDGNQTDRNQKIICSRICALVNRTKPMSIEHGKQWNHKINPTIPRYQQQFNENHYSNRKY